MNKKSLRKDKITVDVKADTVQVGVVVKGEGHEVKEGRKKEE